MVLLVQSITSWIVYIINMHCCTYSNSISHENICFRFYINKTISAASATVDVKARGDFSWEFTLGVQIKTFW